MACRIGITTDGAKTKAHWQLKHPTVKWKILGTLNSRTDAQIRGQELAEQLKCAEYQLDDCPDDPNTQNAQWYVYRVDY